MIGLLAALAASLFAEAALYVNLVEHPARMACGTEIAIAEWAPSYKRATVMQVFLALLSTLAGLTRFLTGGGALWLWGSLLIASVVPYTLLFVLPTNARLQEPERDRGSEETRTLLDGWARLHAVRSALGLAAACAFLLALGG